MSISTKKHFTSIFCHLDKICRQHFLHLLFLVPILLSLLLYLNCYSSHGLECNQIYCSSTCGNCGLHELILKSVGLSLASRGNTKGCSAIIKVSVVHQLETSSVRKQDKLTCNFLCCPFNLKPYFNCVWEAKVEVGCEFAISRTNTVSWNCFANSAQGLKLHI